MTRRTYIADKNFDELATMWSVSMGKKGKHHLDIFIWKTLDAMADNAHPMHSKRGEWVGCYISFPERKKNGGLFGEIHLLQSEIGAGYVTHEFEHAIVDWMCMNLKVIDPWRNGERICYLMSDMISAFWIEFYKRFRVTKGKNASLRGTFLAVT